ncbi:monovalent cation/H+ antiporter subunit D family protein [Nitriliruptor alkaliphilus]|uniref:monovalent cation/H+ antiporter subunit D family protein n=1 Tax=Nitriliruptor alkaliphilus TaxID=427918 RepID=UPI0006982C6E|nr:monovalent cation/H+ antiporter subunit D family protein [Nitriliruptor alkaliphilus]
MSQLPILLLLPLLFGSVLAVLAGLWRPVAAQVVAVVATASTLVLALIALVTVTRDGTLTHELGGWPPPFGIEYVLDPLSAYMVALVALIGTMVVLYPTKAAFDLEPGRGVPLYPLALLLLTGLVGVMLSGDLFHLFVFLEIYAISTYALISLGGDRAVFASFRYLLLGTVGSGLYLLGVGFLYFSTGTLNMADVAAQLPDLAADPAILGSMGLIVLGLALKMALFPLHVWLPDAHSYSPPGVAALLAAVQVKAGAYALIRILFDVYGPAYAGDGVPVDIALTWFGAAGIVVGSVLAIQQTDVKRMLAYSTVAQLGYIGLGIGLATPLALVGALLHVLNHALMKAGLFLVAGGILQRTGLKEIARFAGLGKRMPLVMTGFAIAALSMVGIPPTAGFFSKFYLVSATVETGDWILATIVVGSSLLTAIYFLRLFERIFVLPPQEAVVAEAVEPEPRIVVTVGVLAAGVIAVGLGNAVIVRQVLRPVAEGLLG